MIIRLSSILLCMFHMIVAQDDTVTDDGGAVSLTSTDNDSEPEETLRVIGIASPLPLTEVPIDGLVVTLQMNAEITLRSDVNFRICMSPDCKSHAADTQNLLPKIDCKSGARLYSTHNGRNVVRFSMGKINMAGLGMAEGSLEEMKNGIEAYLHMPADCMSPKAGTLMQEMENAWIIPIKFKKGNF